MTAVVEPNPPSLRSYPSSSAGTGDLPRPVAYPSLRPYSPPAAEVKMSAARAFCVWATTPIDIPALVLGTLRNISNLLSCVKEKCTASRPSQLQPSQYVPTPRAPSTPEDICFEQFAEIIKELSPDELAIFIRVVSAPYMQAYIEERKGEADGLAQGVMAIVRNIKEYEDFVQELGRTHPAPTIEHAFARYHLSAAYKNGIFALPDHIKAHVRSDCEKMEAAPSIGESERALLQIFQGGLEDTICNLGEDIRVVLNWNYRNSAIASFWNQEPTLETGSFQTHHAQMSPQKLQNLQKHLVFQLEFQKFCQIVGQKKILEDFRRKLFNENSFLHQIQNFTKEALREKLSFLPADSLEGKYMQELLQKSESLQTEPQVLMQRRISQIPEAMKFFNQQIQAFTGAAADKKVFFERTQAHIAGQLALLEAQNLLEEVKNVRAIDETLLEESIANMSLIDDFGRLNAEVSKPKPDFVENWQQILKIVAEIKQKASPEISQKLDADLQIFAKNWNMSRLPAHVAAHQAACRDRFRASLQQIQDELELNRGRTQEDLMNVTHRTKELLVLAKSRAIEYLTPRQFQESQKVWLNARMLELRPLLISNSDAYGEWLDCKSALEYLQIFDINTSDKELDNWAPALVAVPEKETQYACLLEGQVFGGVSDAKILVIDGTKQADNWQWRMAKASLTPEKIRALCGNMSANESKWIKDDKGSFVLSDAREGTIQICCHKPSDFWTSPPQPSGLGSLWNGFRNLIGSTTVRSKEVDRVASLTLIKHMAQTGLQGRFNQVTDQDLQNVRFTLSALDANREFNLGHARDVGFQQMRKLFREGLDGNLIPLRTLIESGRPLQELSRAADQQRNAPAFPSPLEWD